MSPLLSCGSLVHMETVTYIAALIAGVVSIASPCILPLLPGVMAYSTEKNKLTPLAIVLGLTVTLTVMGVVSSAFGTLFIAYLDYIKIISGLLIILMGLFILSKTIEDLFLRLWQRLPLHKIYQNDADNPGLIGGFLLGISLGILWIPCIGPILAAILMIAAQQGAILYGASLLLAYSIGLAIPMLLIAYFSNFISGWLSKTSALSIGIRKIAGLVIVIVGIYYLSGFLSALI